MSVDTTSSSSNTEEFITKSKTQLSHWLNHNMKVKITDGRTLIGIFLCTDKDQNIILGSCQEHVNENGNEGRPLGLAMVPGHHVVSIHIDESV